MATGRCRLIVAELRTLRPIALAVFARMTSLSDEIRVCCVELGPQEPPALGTLGVLRPTLGSLLFVQGFARGSMEGAEAFDFIEALVWHEEPSIANEQVDPGPDVVDLVVTKRAGRLAPAVVAAERGFNHRSNITTEPRRQCRDSRALPDCSANGFEQVSIVELRLCDDHSDAVRALHSTWPRPGLDLDVHRDIPSKPKDQVHSTSVKLLARKCNRLDFLDCGPEPCHPQFRGKSDDVVAEVRISTHGVDLRARGRAVKPGQPSRGNDDVAGDVRTKREDLGEWDLDLATKAHGTPACESLRTVLNIHGGV
jgi:hypothetical protein